MLTIGDVLRTLYSRFVILIAVIVGFPFIILMMIFPPKIRYQSRLLYWGLNLFYWIVIKAALVPITFEGDENIPKEPGIFAANHQSALDVPLVGYLLHGKPHLWLARHELLQWKFLGWVLPRLAVVVDTTSREKAMRSMINLMRLVEGTDIDVMIFPEGRRFSDGKVHKFYGGFVTLSKMLKRPVVPVYISGANKVYPLDTFWVKYHAIKVVVGKPFVMEKDETDEAFKERVHKWFVEQSEK